MQLEWLLNLTATAVKCGSYIANMTKMLPAVCKLISRQIDQNPSIIYRLPRQIECAALPIKQKQAARCWNGG